MKLVLVISFHDGKVFPVELSFQLWQLKSRDPNCVGSLIGCLIDIVSEFKSSPD